MDNRDDQQQLLQQLLDLLQDRVKVLQVFHRSAQATWRVQHAGGTQGVVAAAEQATDGDVGRWLAWVVDNDRPRISGALVSVACGAERWNGRCHIQGESAGERLADVDIVRQPAISGGDRVIVLARDITSHKLIEDLPAELKQPAASPSMMEAPCAKTFDEDMHRTQLAADVENKVKSDFMSRVSHELRTPLNGILGFAQLMVMDTAHPLSSEQSRRLELLSLSAHNLLALIDELLQISAPEHGKRAMRMEAVKVSTLLDTSVACVQAMADAQDIAITIAVDPDDRSAVWADADALAQVMVQLLSNAVRYNHPHGRVRVGFVADAMGNISVEDTGHGLSDAELAHLFEPFNRLSAAGPGKGLGLVLSKQLVECMYGELTVASREGAGSRFVVRLPLAPVPRPVPRGRRRWGRRRGAGACAD